MAMRWRGFDLRMVKDPALRSQLSKVDDFLKQINQTVASIINTTTVVSSPTLNFGSPVALGSALADGTSTKASRADHIHVFPPTVRSTANASTLTLTDDATNQLLTSSLGKLTLRAAGQFAATAQGSTSPAFQFSTATDYSAGTLWQLDDAGTVHHDISFEGHHRVASTVGVTASQHLLAANRNLSADSRATFKGISALPTISGDIPGGAYSPIHIGIDCTYSFGPSTYPAVGVRTLRGGRFIAALTSAATGTVQTLNGGRFTAQDNGTWAGLVATAIAGDFTIGGIFAGGLTAAYGIHVASIPAGTDRWGAWASNKIQCDASDFIAAASGKGYIDKDSQSSSAGGGGTARYWRMLTDASATGVAGDVTIAIDSAGTITGTRAGGATGTVLLKLVDAGTSLPTS